jgi:hypothetical protein
VLVTLAGDSCSLQQVFWTTARARTGARRQKSKCARNAERSCCEHGRQKGRCKDCVTGHCGRARAREGQVQGLRHGPLRARAPEARRVGARTASTSARRASSRNAERSCCEHGCRKGRCKDCGTGYCEHASEAIFYLEILLCTNSAQGVQHRSSALRARPSQELSSANYCKPVEVTCSIPATRAMAHALQMLTPGAILSLSCAYAYINGYGQTPFLGWQSWCAIGKCGTDLCTDQQPTDPRGRQSDDGQRDAKARLRMGCD